MISVWEAPVGLLPTVQSRWLSTAEGVVCVAVGCVMNDPVVGRLAELEW
jgi:hypothetical protein